MYQPNRAEVITLSTVTTSVTALLYWMHDYSAKDTVIAAIIALSITLICVSVRDVFLIGWHNADSEEEQQRQEQQRQEQQRERDQRSSQSSNENGTL